LNANRIPDDDAGQFFRKVMKTNRWPQGLWIVTPEGKELAFHYFRTKPGETTAQGKTRWIRETHETLDAGLKAFGPLAKRDLRKLAGYTPLPDRGVGVNSHGGVRLAVSVTAFRKGQREGDPAVDSIHLSEKDWAALQPAKPEGGSVWNVPVETAAKFVSALSPMTDLIYVPQPKDAKSAELKGEIISLANGVAKIRFTGRWESLHLRDGQAKFPVRSSAEADGIAFYDVKTKEMRSFLLVFRGEYRNVPPWDQPQATGAVVEWRAAR
jgi:hypothetical protein